MGCSFLLLTGTTPCGIGPSRSNYTCPVPLLPALSESVSAIVWSFYASPILAGNLIYFLSSPGTAFVLSPGRAFKLVAVNKLEAGGEWGNADHFAGSPLCDGKNLFIRSDNYMYCIGEAQGK